MSKQIQNAYFEGERSLYGAKDMEITSCVFGNGESPLKEGQRLKINDTIFTYKYPLWYCNDVEVEGGVLETMARSGIWHSQNLTFHGTSFQAPKLFRRCKAVKLDQVYFANAEETLWTCDGVEIKNSQARGDYFGKDSQNVYLENVTIVGNYAFDGGKNIEAHHCRFVTKDNFWNCENVTIYDSVLDGEYLAWNSQNVTLVNCTIRSSQGLNYIDHLTMKNCKLLDSDLVFEYGENLDVEITTPIDSVKNPISGKIAAPEIRRLIMDPEKINPDKTEIVCPKIGERADLSDQNQEPSVRKSGVDD